MSVTQPTPAIATSGIGFASASIGKKVLVAATGILLVAFVIGHMLGNLQIFLGQDAINKYAVTLQHLGPLLWIVRLILLTAVIIHIWVTVLLYFENRAARPVNYRVKQYAEAGITSRFMIYSGIALFLFIVYHLMQFTLQITNPEYVHLTDSLGRHDVYSMMILGFQNVAISGVYAAAMFFLALHINHATFSLFQTLGLCNDRWEVRWKRISMILAVVLFLGYVSIPVGVLTGFVALPGGGM